MSPDNPADFSTAFTQVLIDYQYIEEALKMYLARAFDFMSTVTQGKVAFKYDYKSLDRDSLGKLVDKFERFSDNGDLIARLRKAVPERNRVAHQGFLYQQDGPGWTERVAEMQAVHAQTGPLLLDLISEVKGLERRTGTS